jgi:hypothetical protein
VDITLQTIEEAKYVTSPQYLTQCIRCGVCMQRSEPRKSFKGRWRWILQTNVCKELEAMEKLTSCARFLDSCSGIILGLKEGFIEDCIGDCRNTVASDL